jgi:hypothetical protein
MANNILTQNQVRNLFEYRDGELFWKVFTSPSAPIGSKVGHLASDGYIQTHIKRKFYRNHRIIFLYHHGYLPQYIDHIDGNRSNNQIENLREATKHQNGCNTKINKNNTSGVKGVSWHKKTKKWYVRVSIHRKSISIGYYDSLEDAKIAMIEARNKHHGKYARHQ